MLSFGHFPKVALTPLPPIPFLFWTHFKQIEGKHPRKKVTSKLPKNSLKLLQNYPYLFGIGSSPPLFVVVKYPKESPKNYLKFWIWVDPPPPFGKCSKESSFFWGGLLLPYLQDFLKAVDAQNLGC